MRAYLKIKVVSLGDEIRRIHSDERKYKQKPGPIAREVFWGLRHHRLNLRPKVRAAGLAYAFLRGKPYRTIERSCHVAPCGLDILENVWTFTNGGDRTKEAKQVKLDEIHAWLKAE